MHNIYTKGLTLHIQLNINGANWICNCKRLYAVVYWSCFMTMKPTKALALLLHYKLFDWCVKQSALRMFTTQKTQSSMINDVYHQMIAKNGCCIHATKASVIDGDSAFFLVALLFCESIWWLLSLGDMLVALSVQRCE